MSESNELPTGWVESLLGDMANFEMGQAPPGTECNYEGRGTLFVKAGEFGIQRPLEKEWTTRPLKFGRERDVFICVVGATCGKLNLGADCAIGRSVAAIQPLGCLDQRYLYYQLQPFVMELRASSAGSAQGVLTKKHLARILLRIAPLIEQHRIVAKIEELFSDLDAGVAALKRAKANLKRYRAAVLKAAVEGKLTAEWRAKHPKTEPASKLLERILIERRKKWETDQLAKFAAAGKEPPINWKAKYVEPTLVNELPFTSSIERWAISRLDTVSTIIDCLHKTPTYCESGFPMVRVTDVKSGFLDLSNTLKVTKEVYLEFTRRHMPMRGDVVFSRVGTYGNVSLVNSDDPFCIGQNTAIISPKINSHYLHYCIQSPPTKSCIDHAVVGTTQKTISLKSIGELLLPIPPLIEQEQIVEILDERMSAIDHAESEIVRGLKRVASLRQSILKQAFEGKLVPQNPSDEPVSALLERIQANNEQVEGNGKLASQNRKRKRVARQ